jgi:RNA polymerase sigma-70 factor (ECF subfamily)
MGVGEPLFPRSAERSDADRGIAERIAAGDEDAFADAYDRYADVVFGAVLRFSGDRENAAEVVQDAFLSLWRRAHQFDATSGSLLGWLLGIARNRAIDRFRSESRRPTGQSVPLEEGIAGPRHDSADPWAVVEGRWTQSIVRTIVSELPDAEREVLVMAYSAGLSQSEISGQTGLPLGTVKSRTRRAMAHLRGRLTAMPGMLDALAVSQRR